MNVRPARAVDLDGMVELAAAKREQYAGYEAEFWRPAPDARARHRPYLAAQLDDDAFIVFVAEENSALVGFAAGRILDAPRVYDPGGATCVVDDFAVDAPARWATAGAELLAAVRHRAAERGAAQVVVVCARRDEPERTALRDAGLHSASEWWVASAALGA